MGVRNLSLSRVRLYPSLYVGRQCKSKCSQSGKAGLEEVVANCRVSGSNHLPMGPQINSYMSGTSLEVRWRVYIDRQKKPGNNNIELLQMRHSAMGRVESMFHRVGRIQLMYHRASYNNRC